MKIYTEKAKERLQSNLATVRKAAGWTAAELGEYIGVTKQTISNLENHRNVMTKAQYIAIRALLDYELQSNPDNKILADVVGYLLDADEISETDVKKVESTIDYITSAKEKKMDSTMLAATASAICATLGFLPLISGLISTPIWITAIKAAKKENK